MKKHYLTVVCAVLTVTVVFAVASAARELSWESKCDPELLQKQLEAELDQDGLPANPVAESCPVEAVWTPKNPKKTPPARAPDACKEQPWNNGINFVPFYPPHYCANLCPGLVPCCVWDPSSVTGHSCRCYRRGCPVKYTPKNTDSPL